MIFNYGQSFKIDTDDDDKYSNTSGFFSIKPRGQVNTSLEFVSLVDRDLKLIISKPIGRDLIDLLDKRNRGVGAKLAKIKLSDGREVPIPKTVTIKNGFGTMERKNINTSARSADAGKFARQKGAFQLPGQTGNGDLAGNGANSVLVRYNPKQNYTKLLNLKTPSFIALAHELIHAWHWLSGRYDFTNAGGSNDPVSGLDKSIIQEEAYTVGQGRYKSTRISENSIRAEHGLGERKYYTKPGDCDLAFLS